MLGQSELRSERMSRLDPEPLNTLVCIFRCDGPLVDSFAHLPLDIRRAQSVPSDGLVFYCNTCVLHTRTE